VSLNNSLAKIRPQVKHVLLDFSSVNFIDVSACDELLTFIKELQGEGITIAFARVRDAVRENLQLGGIETVVDSANFYERITAGVNAWQRRKQHSS
jgi:MFS superfamily sulfate permease-like transporter